MSNRLRFITQATIADAADVPIADAGAYYSTDNTEAALQSVGSQLAQILR